MSDSILVILTGIYVIATIFISFFNYRSAKATRDQISESRAQFVDANRASVNIDFEIVRDYIYTLKVINHGNRTASNVRINIADDFLSLVDDIDRREHLDLLNESVFSIGIGQSFYISIGSKEDFVILSQKPILIELSYSDCFSEYKENIKIELSQYCWGLLYNAPINDMSSSIEKISKDIHTLSQK